MGREERLERRKKQQKLRRRRRIFFFILAFFLIIIIIAGFYRSNQSKILQQEEYLNSVPSQLYFLRDSDYLEINDFSSADLSVPEGTKVNGYDVLTTHDMIINSEYLASQLNGLNTLIANNTFENWDAYSLELQNALSSNSLFSPADFSYFKETARYFPEKREDLENDINLLNSLNTGQPVNLTLNRFGIMRTGFIYSTISDYDILASEAVLGSVSHKMIEGINTLSTEDSSALRIINNDHCFIITEVDAQTLIQGESEALELKGEFKGDLSNAEYYNMLITRVDRLRYYPSISFIHNDQSYPAYLVDVVEDDNKKILVIMAKEYLSELSSFDKLNCELNTQDYRAWVIPQSAIIKRDDQNFVELLEKGYFTQEIEVNVNLYDKGKAILRVSDNPNLSDGMTIKEYP